MAIAGKFLEEFSGVFILNTGFRQVVVEVYWQIHEREIFFLMQDSGDGQEVEWGIYLHWGGG